jgi:hypothetical protein
VRFLLGVLTAYSIFEDAGDRHPFQVSVIFILINNKLPDALNIDLLHTGNDAT